MANGYSRINEQGETAPKGFHYMSDGTLMSDAEHIKIYGELKIARSITNFTMETDDIPSSATSRGFRVVGERGAVFGVQVSDGEGKFYDFKTMTFTSTFTSQNRLSITMSGGSYSGSILFPADADGQTYTVFLFASPHHNSELSGFSTDKVSYTTTISQLADTVITFAPSSTNTNNYTSGSLASGVNATSTASPITTTENPITINWKFTNASHDSYGFGLIVDRDPVDTDWYFQTTEAISSNPAGDGVSNDKVTVADLTNISTGMELIYHKGTTAPSSTTFVTAIDIRTKTLTFSTSQTFEDGETMTLRASGSSNIEKATGALIDFSTVSTIKDPLTKTVRAAVSSSTTVTLDGTYGVGKGATVTGVGFSNASSNPVVSVSASSSGGSMLMTTAQTLKVGTKLYITPNVQSFKIISTPVVSRGSTSSVTIYLNLDNFVTIGTVS
mgnify:FL=1